MPPIPPEAAGSFISAVLTLGTALAVYFTARVTRRTPGSSIEAPSVDGVEPKRIDTTGLNPKIAEAMAESNREMSAQLTLIINENRSHEARIQALEADNAAMKAERTGLVAHIVTLREGIKDGTIPPLPALAEAIKHLFPGD